MEKIIMEDSIFDIKDGNSNILVFDQIKNYKMIDVYRYFKNRNIKFSSIDMEDKTEIDSIENCFALSRMMNIKRIIVQISKDGNVNDFRDWINFISKMAQNYDIDIVIRTVNLFADTIVYKEFMKNMNGNVRVCFNTLDVNDSYNTVIENIGAYIDMVDISNNSFSTKEQEELIFALSAIHFDGYVIQRENDVSIIRNIERKKDKTLSQMITDSSIKYHDHIAFIFPEYNYEITYGDFEDKVNEFAKSLIAMDIKKGDHVAIWMSNTPEWFIAFFAITKIGAIALPINSQFKKDDMEYVLSQSDACALIMTEGYKGNNYMDVIEAIIPEINNDMFTRCCKLPFLKNIITVGFEHKNCVSWGDAIRCGKRVSDIEIKKMADNVFNDDVCNIQYTSGTTGFPKGAMLTHEAVIRNGFDIGCALNLNETDVMLIQVFMFHCFGIVLSMLSSMTHGAEMIVSSRFQAERSIEYIEKYNITCVNGVPTMFTKMMEDSHFSKDKFKTVKKGIMAGSNCLPSIMSKVSDMMNMRGIISIFGLTEASPGCTGTTYKDSFEKRIKTVGRNLPDVECKIIDSKTVNEVKTGEQGEFIAKGYNIMRGYYKNPTATSKAIRNGWLYTGDLATRDEHGYYTITGRATDMIIRGGENIYPKETNYE